jgi:hypothetical protein
METPPPEIPFVTISEKRRKIFKQSSIEDTDICHLLNSPNNLLRDQMQQQVSVALCNSLFNLTCFIRSDL